MKNLAGLFFAVVLALSLTLPLGATAQSPSPNHQYNESNMHAPPVINIFNFETQSVPLGWLNSNGWGGTDNPVVIYTDTGSVTISIWVEMPRFHDPLYPSMPAPGNTFSNGYLTSVSYVASWQNNQTIQAYINTSKNQQYQVRFNLTSVPYGYHVIHVYATCDITPYDGATESTYDIPQSAEKVLNFTVAAPPTPTPSSTPTPTSTPNSQNTASLSTVFSVTIIVVAAVLAVVVFMVLKKTRKANS